MYQQFDKFDFHVLFKAKRINQQYTKGRTIQGINREIYAHWVA